MKWLSGAMWVLKEGGVLIQYGSYHLIVLRLSKSALVLRTQEISLKFVDLYVLLRYIWGFYVWVAWK